MYSDLFYDPPSIPNSIPMITKMDMKRGRFCVADVNIRLFVLVHDVVILLI